MKQPSEFGISGTGRNCSPAAFCPTAAAHAQLTWSIGADCGTCVRRTAFYSALVQSIFHRHLKTNRKKENQNGKAASPGESREIDLNPCLCHFRRPEAIGGLHQVTSPAHLDNTPSTARPSEGWPRERFTSNFLGQDCTRTEDTLHRTTKRLPPLV